MSGLFSAIGRGLSQAGYAAGDLYAKQSLADQAAAAQEQRERRLLEWKEQSENRQREQQVARIDTAAGGLADAQVGKTRSAVESGIADRSNWSADQQAAVDQSLALDREAAVNDPKTRTMAAIKTGDISPKDAAVLTQKDDAAIWKQLWEQTKLESAERRAEMREDRADARMDKRLAAQFQLLDKRLAAREKAEGGDKANTLQSTQVDGNGYLVGVFRDGSTKRMTDPDGNPITSQSFEQRVDRVANSLRKEGDSKFRKMPEEELRSHVRKTLISGDTGKSATPAAPAAPKPAAPKPAGPASAARPPLSSFLK